MLHVTMVFIRYFKRITPPDSASFPSVVPSLSGNDVQHVNDGVKHSMEQESSDKKAREVHSCRSQMSQLWPHGSSLSQWSSWFDMNINNPGSEIAEI